MGGVEYILLIFEFVATEHVSLFVESGTFKDVSSGVIKTYWIFES